MTGPATQAERAQERWASYGHSGPAPEYVVGLQGQIDRWRAERLAREWLLADTSACKRDENGLWQPVAGVHCYVR